MTESVIDSSVLAKYLLKEQGWERVSFILRERPYSLSLAVKETVNALWRRVYLLKDVSVEKAFLLLEDLLDIKNNVLRIESQDKYLKQALEIALKYGV